MPKKRISYYYDEDLGNYKYAQGHPMRPHRIRITHQLLLDYNLHRKMEMFKPQRLPEKEMQTFHTTDYTSFLRIISPDNMNDHMKLLHRFNVGVLEGDCPVFNGLFEFCQICAGGSVGGAVKLNKEKADVVINWAGGLHHAKRCEASGFCYINDCVLGILELLKRHPRVLYIDIDIHHGDGVEEAFYTTDRVMTVSFHKFGEFFPGTGTAEDVGVGEGRNYSLNFPMRDGMDDKSYESVFKPVIAKVMEMYQPTAVVLQCGADSLSGDRLGCFNLSTRGHSECVRFLNSYDVPLMVLGGGGYTIHNVARCWTVETAALLDCDLAEKMPVNDYAPYFAPEYSLNTTASNMVNLNTRAELEKTKIQIFEMLRELPHAPSTPIDHNVPPSAGGEDNDRKPEDDMDTDTRKENPNYQRQAEGEFYDDEDDVDGADSMDL